MKQIPRGQVVFPIHVRLSGEQNARLSEMCAQSGLSQSQVIRHLIDQAAWVLHHQASLRPAIIRTEAPGIYDQPQREPAK